MMAVENIVFQCQDDKIYTAYLWPKEAIVADSILDRLGIIQRVDNRLYISAANGYAIYEEIGAEDRAHTYRLIESTYEPLTYTCAPTDP